MTIEKIQFTYPGYVEWLKEKGGAYSIGHTLMRHFYAQNGVAFKTMEELGFTFFTDDCWQQAGELILSNEKIVIN